MPTDDKQQTDPLTPVDDYEQLIDDAISGLSTCNGDDCRDPRTGPFVIDIAASDEPVVYCYWCFASERLRIDPDEIGLL